MKASKRGFFAHIHPPRVTRYALRFRSTWGLGVLLCALFLILGVTGLLLAAVYAPDLAGAHDSVWEIAHVYPGGGVIRTIHYLAGNAFAVVSMLHLFRVVLAGAYAGPRYRNYLYGLALLAAGIGALATGYFLPMTETAYWAMVVGVSFLDYLPGGWAAIKALALGGRELGDAALVRLYVLHVALLPVLMAGLASLHLWRIRKDKGLIKPEGLAPEALKPVSWRSATLREWTVFLAACVLLLGWAMIAPLPLEPPPAYAHPPNPVKAAWFFVALQETLSYSVFWGGLVPMLLLPLAAVLGPLWAASGAEEARRGRRLLLFGATVTTFLLYGALTLIGLWLRGPNWSFSWP